jgi:type VI secretion system protein ImpH
MATASRRRRLDLIQALQREPHAFGFLPALRLLALAAPAAAAQLRFRTPASLAFPASELTAIRQVGTRGRLEVEVGFLGLTGPSGILPPHYTELLQERSHLFRDRSLHAFLDLFSHRLCCLFLGAWRKYRFHLAWEQGQGDTFTGQLRALVPQRLPPGQPALPPALLAHCSGLLSRRPLPASSLVALLGTYFQVPVRLESFVGQWLTVPPGDRTRLGAKGQALGAGAFLGQRLWDRQTKVRLCLGPLTEPQFRSFLPGAAGASALRALTGLGLGQHLACDLALALTPAGMSPPRLTSPDAPRLGLTTWLHTLPASGPPAPVAFRLLA